MVRDYLEESISKRMKQPHMKFLCSNPELVEWNDEVNGTRKNGPVSGDTSVLVYMADQTDKVREGSGTRTVVTILVSKEVLFKIAEQLEDKAHFTESQKAPVELPGRFISVVHDHFYNGDDGWKEKFENAFKPKFYDEYGDFSINFDKSGSNEFDSGDGPKTM